MPGLVDLRGMLGPVRQQGPFRSTCLSFTVSAAHEQAREHAVPLSVEVLYWGAKQHDGHRAPGTTFPAADLALRHWGQPDEASWPYDPWRDDTTPAYQPPDGALDPAGCHLATLTPLPVDIASFRAALDTNTVIAIGAPTWPGLRRPHEGHLSNPRADELDGEYHALLVVGYRLDTDEILLRNSWGISWGHNGHAWIPFTFVTDHIDTAWTLTTTPAATGAAASHDAVGTQHPPGEQP